MKQTKNKVSISIDSQLNSKVKENVSNRSKYIEWLLYQNLKKSGIDVSDIML